MSTTLQLVWRRAGATGIRLFPDSRFWRCEVSARYGVNSIADRNEKCLSDLSPFSRSTSGLRSTLDNRYLAPLAFFLGFHQRQTKKSHSRYYGACLRRAIIKTRKHERISRLLAACLRGAMIRAWAAAKGSSSYPDKPGSDGMFVKTDAGDDQGSMGASPHRGL